MSIPINSIFFLFGTLFLLLLHFPLPSFSYRNDYVSEADDQTDTKPNNVVSLLPSLKDILNSPERLVITGLIALVLMYVLFFSKEEDTLQGKTSSSSSSSLTSTPSSSKAIVAPAPVPSSNVSVPSSPSSSSSPVTPSSIDTNTQSCSSIFEWDPENDYLSSGSSCKVYTCRLRPEMVQRYPDIPKNLVVKEYIIADMRKEIQQKPETAAALVHLMKQAEREYAALSKFRHPQIVRLISMFKEYHTNRSSSSSTRTNPLDAFPDEVHVVMERAPVVAEGPLAKTMTSTEMKFLRLFAGPTDLHYYFGTRNRLTEPQVALIMYQILLAVRELHKVNLVHRDLKPANILVFGEKVTKFDIIPICKLGDFGLARDATTINAAGQVIDTEKTFGIGTPLYIAPEAFRVKEQSVNTASYGTEFDVFSLGTILFNLVTKEFPYDLNSFGANMVNMIRTANIRWSLADNLHISVPCVSLMKKMTNVNGKLRPTVEDVLRDPWFDTVRNEAVDLFGQ